jgi:sterol 3beta-glucosyltransferase
LKITILTYGSRGDVQPFVALAMGLQKAGHSVCLAAPHRFSEFAEQHGICFSPLPGDPEEISARLNEAKKNVLRTINSLRGYVFSIAGQVADAAVEASKDADLIVHSFLFTTGGHSFARALGIPDVSVQGFPMFAPTRAFPNVAMPSVPPGVLSYFTHWLANQIFWYVGNIGFRKWRVAVPGVEDVKLHWPFDPSQNVLTPLLFSYSPTVVPRPEDWTASNIHVTGYFLLDTPTSYTPPVELELFLAAGDPPFCVTFGSMINQDTAKISLIVRDALTRSRQRGIILTGWSGIEPDAHDEDLLYLEAAPHDWLFPRCLAVLHHGGAGTTAAGLRAGIPNLVIPHAADQWFWGKRVAAIGAGPHPLDIDELTAESLTKVLTQSTEEFMQTRALEIGRKIRTEDGVGEAVRLIEQHAFEAYNISSSKPTSPAV